MGDIVVFTDDDVVVPKDWVQTIVAITNRWPDDSVFGGRLTPLWPDPPGKPDWVANRLIERVGFIMPDFPEKEGPYPGDMMPHGTNYWVRGKVFEGGRKFNEAVGPRPKNRIMGSESSFLAVLRRDGYDFVYSPDSVVQHKIPVSYISVDNVLRRAFRMGRQGPHINGIPQPEVYEKSPFMWGLKRRAATAYYALRLGASALKFNKTKRVTAAIGAMINYGYNVEALRVAKAQTEEESGS